MGFMEYVWSMHRLFMEYVCSLQGICMEYVTNMHRICMEYVWKIMEYAWKIHLGALIFTCFWALGPVRGRLGGHLRGVLKKT